MNRRVWTGVALLLLVAAPAFAQAGATAVLRGLIDFVAAEDSPARSLNTVNTRDSNFDPLRARLFVEAARGKTQVFLQFLLSPESFDDKRIFGAYLMHRILEDRDLWVEVGKIPVHDGIWASHTYSNKNPLISIPLAYYWKSSLPNHMLPVDLDQLLENRGRGQYGIVYADSTGPRGERYSTNTILYDNCWNYGLFSLGTVGDFEYAVGLTYGPAGAPVASLDDNEDLAIHAKVGYAVTPGFRTWISAQRGAYLARVVSQYLPAGKTVNDYMQELLVVSADWRWRYLFLMGEVFFNRYETPLTSDPLTSRSFYIQGVYTLTPGIELALRYDELRFGDVETDSGAVNWDDDVQRVEGGLVWHVSRDLRLKGIVQATDPGSGWDADHVVPAVQASFSF